MNFRNSSQKLQSLLSLPPEQEMDSSILQFSTFRSEDYHFHEDLSHRFDQEDSIEGLSYLEEEDDMEEGSCQFIREDERKRGGGFGGAWKKLEFRNDGRLVRHLLGIEKKQKRHGISFVNKSSALH